MINLEITEGELDVLKALIKADAIRTSPFAMLLRKECTQFPVCPNVRSLEEKLDKL
ncbi:MAG: hypothetical protein KAH32_02730 [Chlamydiia bacterium]|nr:hypothetical protein [Chlamydiia bacterium]